LWPTWRAPQRVSRRILKALIVEDDDSRMSEWNDAITAHHADAGNKGFQIDHVVCKPVPDAKRKLDPGINRKRRPSS
jgi:hypothetical protein